MRGPSAREGVIFLDGKPQFFLCTDYPYFRDDAENWRDRLEAQREAGLLILTCYLPWRHHAPNDPLQGGGTYDFTGETQPNRNVIGLVETAHELDLRVLLKPGPFVHAELPYGGLPDYVCPGLNPAVEPERNAYGEPVRWAFPRLKPSHRHALPAPFGTAYNTYVRDWLRAVAREVAAPRFWPRGPVIGMQLMNEGIYSDSSRAEPTEIGYAHSTLERFRAFLRDRYGDLESYNRLHGTRHLDWWEVDPPRSPSVLAGRRDLLAYLDWSEFQGRLYLETARLLKRDLVEGGLPGDFPALFNFNPNKDIYRDKPAANDGWYTRIGAARGKEFTFGSTDWLGVLADDPSAFRQFVMANTAARGPAMEQNWGFSSQYYAPFQRVTPSHFETMVAVACGVTGVTAYTLAGTKRWREDPNVASEWVAERTNDHEDETSGDYPGDAPILSNGTRTPKYWTLKQIAQYLDVEGPRFVEHGAYAPVAWAIYPPYAWAGQWLPRGDPDDFLWRPPLKAVPRGAYHGLDAFVEMMVDAGTGLRQVDVSRDDVDLSHYRVLAISAHEYMDAATQERLADFVENGGTLLLTNLVPECDENLEPLEGALATRVFPHRVVDHQKIQGAVPLDVEGEPLGLAQEFVSLVEPPPGAEVIARFRGRCTGYLRRVGRGQGIFLGVGPWRARYSGDDSKIARANQRLVWRLIRRAGDANVTPARPLTSPGEVMVWQHGDPGRDEQHLFVVVRDTSGEIEVEFTRPGGGRSRLTLASPSQAVHAIAVEGGRLRACYLKGVNDLRGEAVAPFVALDDETWSAEDPCDLCVTPSPEGLHVAVAHLETEGTEVRLPVDPGVVERAESERGAVVNVRRVRGGVAFRVRDVREAGTCEVRFRGGRPLRGGLAREPAGR